MRRLSKLATMADRRNRSDLRPRRDRALQQDPGRGRLLGRVVRALQGAEPGAGERPRRAAAARVLLAKVDVDSNQAPRRARYGVQGIPAVKAFRDGEVVDEFVGAVPPAKVEAFFDALLPSQGGRAAGDGRRALAARGGRTGAAPRRHRRRPRPGAARARGRGGGAGGGRGTRGRLRRRRHRRPRPPRAGRDRRRGLRRPRPRRARGRPRRAARGAGDGPNGDAPATLAPGRRPATCSAGDRRHPQRSRPRRPQPPATTAASSPPPSD